jgi:hypothetical protein
VSDAENHGGWIREVLGGVLERAERQLADAEAHAASCTDRPCERCERWVCPCGAPVNGARECHECLARDVREAQLEPTRKSIPARFRWVIGAPESLVLSRVRGPAELVRHGLASPPSTSLLFMGPTGAGKTSLAAAMLDAWVRQDPTRRRGALFVEASWLARARARHKLGAGESPLVTQALEAPLLLLDDLGQEREDRDGCITDVVYGRENASLPTWVTCGLTTPEQTLEAFAEALSRRYDGGFVRRIVEHGKRVLLGAR